MITVEDVERRQKVRKFVFRAIMASVVGLLCLAVAWLITHVGYEEFPP